VKTSNIKKEKRKAKDDIMECNIFSPGW
jgi:hypothetical protein